MEDRDFGEANRQYEPGRIEYQLALGLMVGERFGKKVLDAGAGKGEFADILTKKGYQVSCVEGAKELYDELWGRGYEAANVDLEEEGLPFPDSSFNLIVSLEVIEHLWNTEHYLKELYRVVRPDGHILLTTPNYNYWSFRVRALMGQAERFLTQDYHKKLFTARSLPKALEPYFVVERLRGRGMIPKLHTHYSVPFCPNMWAMHVGVLAKPKK